MRLVEFFIWLTDEDRIRHHHRTEKGRILSFVVQYEVSEENEWQPVVRYDTSHGYAHKDQFRASGKPFKERLGEMDFNEALTYAEEDLRAHWREYRKYFLG